MSPAQCGRIATRRAPAAWLFPPTAAICCLLLAPPAMAGDPAKVAARIDAAIDHSLAEQRIPPSPRADDAEFLRRVYLDLIGRPPAADEVRKFVADSQHLPEIAKWTDQLALVRSMSTREGDHRRARDHLRTGYAAQGSIQFPVLGSLVSNEYAGGDADLPNYVSILPRGLFNPGIPAAGFLGPNHAPLLVDGSGEGDLSVQDLSLPRDVAHEQLRRRLDLLRRTEDGFLSARPGPAADGHRSAYDRATRLMSPAARGAFRLDDEQAKVRETYGRSRFGQGCLLARRLIERDVPFVEVTLGGWDTHNNNFEQVQNLCGTLDRAWSALLRDLQNRGLLDSTLVVWMGEFGRTPVINPRQGRDHYPKAWTVVLGGGGIQGGSIIGRTSDDGLEIKDRAVTTADLLATICLALGLDPNKQNISNVARPIRLVDPKAQPIRDLLV